MRAVYISEITPGANSILIKDEKHHHICHVCRFEIGDQILILNGKGDLFYGTIESISKKETFINISSEKHIPKSSFTHKVVIGIPKKDALELMLKMATEMGADEINLIRSEYSVESLPTIERMMKVIIPSIEQSNNPWLPTLKFLKNWSDFDFRSHNCHVLHPEKGNQDIKTNDKFSSTLFIGPEGGWSPKELIFFSENKCQFINLPTPILRAPTALACGVGFILNTSRA